MNRILLTILALSAAAGLLYVVLETIAPPTPLPPPVYEPSDVPLPEDEPDEEVFAEGEDQGEPPAPEHAAQLSGQVVRDSDGLPVVGAAVTAWVGKFRRTVRSDVAGRFDFGAVPPGNVRLQARSAEYVDPRPRVQKLEMGERKSIVIRLMAGAVLVGHVTDRETGESLAEVRISVAGSTLKQAESGAAGDYRLTGLPFGLVSIAAESDDYPPTRVGVRVAEGETEVVQDFSLLRGATASGKVSDSTGNPVAGATVGPSFASGRKATSGEDGRFLLTGLPVERSLIINAEAEGYVTGRSETLRFESGESFDGLEIVLSRGGTVVGKVVRADGTPAAEATVRLVPLARQGGVARLPSAKSGPDGQFTIEAVLPGDHRASATLRGTLGGSAEVTGVTEDGVVGGIVIKLGAADSITGTVTDPAGKPIARAQVSARPVDPIPGGRYVSARSKEDGTFSLDGLSPGTYHVGVRSARGGPEAASVQVASGTEDVRLTMPTPGSVSGRVLMPDGSPIAVCSLRLSPEGGSGGTVFKRLRREDLGEFKLEGISPGEYSLTASSNDGYSTPQVPVSVASGREVSGLRLTLDAPGRVEGRVLSETGQPVAGAQVHAALEEQGVASRRMERSGPDGMFELSGLRPGTYRLQATKDGAVALTPGVVVVSGVVALADIRFSPTGSVLVTAVDGTGTPVVGAAVHARVTDGVFVPVRPEPIRESMSPTERVNAARESRRKAATTDENGVCLRSGIPEGEVTISVHAKGYELAQQNLVVTAGRTRNVKIVLVAGAGAEAFKRDRK